VGQTSGLTATVSLTIKPVTAVAHATGVQGSANSLRGFGFGANELVRAYWYPGLLPLGSATTNVTGTMTLSFTVPLSPTGAYAVLASGQTSRTMAMSAVTLLPALIVRPASGAHGSPATVVGTGFKANETVTLLWDCSTSACASTTALSAQPVHANANGDFSSGVTVPTMATLGVQLIGARGGNGSFATTPYNVTS
jgi:hypothetical protein